MDFKLLASILVVVIIGVIAASMIQKKFGIGSWEESYEEE